MIRAHNDEVVGFSDDGSTSPARIHNICKSQADTHYLRAYDLLACRRRSGPVQHVILYHLTRKSELMAHCALIEAAYPDSEDF